MIPITLLGAWVLACSVIVGTLYAWDKWRAVRGGWRVAELTLHVGELLGGWPGALVAGRLLRHKTLKPTYRRVRTLCIIANIVLLAGLLWLLYRYGPPM